MKKFVTRAAVVLGLSVAFLATGAHAQKRSGGKRPGSTAKPPGKKGGKKPKKPGAKPVEMGDLDEPPAAPASPAAPGTTAGAAGAAGAASAEHPSGDAAAGDDADDDGTPEGEAGEAAGADAPKRISVALLLGAGLNGATCGLSTCNAYGFGLGLRGGYTLPMKVYVGGTFVYHVGFSKEQALAGQLSTAYKGSISYFGPEVGYEATVGPILVRPYLGLGIGVYSASATQSFGAQKGVPLESGGARLALWPGVTGLYGLGRSFFVGADLRFVLVLSAENAFAAFATGGLKF